MATQTMVRIIPAHQMSKSSGSNSRGGFNSSSSPRSHDSSGKLVNIRPGCTILLRRNGSLRSLTGDDVSEFTEEDDYDDDSNHQPNGTTTTTTIHNNNNTHGNRTADEDDARWKPVHGEEVRLSERILSLAALESGGAGGVHRVAVRVRRSALGPPTKPKRSGSLRNILKRSNSTTAMGSNNNNNISNNAPSSGNNNIASSGNHHHHHHNASNNHNNSNSSIGCFSGDSSCTSIQEEDHNIMEDNDDDDDDERHHKKKNAKNNPPLSARNASLSSGSRKSPSSARFKVTRNSQSNHRQPQRRRSQSAASTTSTLSTHGGDLQPNAFRSGRRSPMPRRSAMKEYRPLSCNSLESSTGRSDRKFRFERSGSFKV